MYSDKPSIDELISAKILFLDDMTSDDAVHSGTPQPFLNSPVGSGRYRRGTGEHKYQRHVEFYQVYSDYKSQGMTDAQIAKLLDMKTNTLRARVSNASNEIRAYKIATAVNYKNQGMNTSEIGRRMGINESSVRTLLKDADTNRTSMTRSLANDLKKECDEKGLIDVGIGVEREIGVSQNRMMYALEMLKDEGYSVITVDVPQVTQKDQKTTFKVLAPEGTTWADVRYNLDKIQSINKYSDDGGETLRPFEYPRSVDSKRILIKYAEDGGTDMDGVIELRRGVEDISLGNSSYAQVRIAVDNSHYLKGMAVYSDDLPDGVDIRFNTNKSQGTPMLGPKDNTVLKPLKNDPDNPFGAAIKPGEAGQRHYIDENGKQQLSCINKLKEEGDWEKYSRNLSSQFLSKQSKQLIDQQLDLAYKSKEEEFNTICSLTNPTIKKKLLESFANDCDSAAVDLKAAALPRQSSKVILPVPTLKDNEIYAPTYKDGEHVVLIRYPHGGTFEIPELVVNNKQKDAKKNLGNIIDAVGINSKVAERLSGADFDGDTVVVIPVNDRVKVRTKAPLKDLVGFDPKLEYKGYEGMKVMDSRTKGIEMGKVSNLITDMTLRGAPDDDLAKAVKHSMVVIDAEKHGLDWKRSEKENDIASLKEKYQGRKDAGASTLISKASSDARVPERKRFSYKIDPETGEKIYTETGRIIKYENGKETPAKTKITKMTKALEETGDARTLSSGTPQEEAYASYANKLYSLANSARKEYLVTPNLESSPSAKKLYSAEVDSLNAQLNTALKNAPKERQALLIANETIRKKKEANPLLKDDKDELKKVSNQAMANARTQVGANKKEVQIQISDREWEAIQAGAVSDYTLKKILNNTDLDTVKQLAMPRNSTSLSSGKQSSIRNMSSMGYTIDEIATSLGISASTVSKYIK